MNIYAIPVERIHNVNEDGTIEIVIDELEMIREIINGDGNPDNG